MKLIEADGKKLLRDAGIATPPGVFLSMDAATWPADAPWTGPVFVKAQVLQGRRGASGLVMSCASAEELPDVLTTLRKRLEDIPCAGFLCEQSVTVVHEWFVAVDVDRETADWRVSLSRTGGMDVATAVAFSFSALDRQNVPQDLKDIVSRLATLAYTNDAVHAEINPVAEMGDGVFIALDAKIELDDAAAFRHPEWADFHHLSPLGRAYTEREAVYDEFLKQAGHRGTFGRYLELDGDIALILSGGGASLLALDAMQRAGGRAANYLEVSGNPDPEKLCEAVRIALSKPGLKGLWVAGSFANFTDINATCQAILQAVEDAGLSIPMVIRRDGPNADDAERHALSWAEARSTFLLFHRATISLEESARALTSVIHV